ncbi:hypothetical protein DFH08DRAFT_1025159 [Mycena albidolilacea]|uniref:Uncharacterized protein n=1 Tax=Mycena albidolilacea TaxID=1033008 RepID=A0AAD7AMC6_9AGAR|nr:hypothetical protein DFH08DRAFT_1025159 [Mycena albidolilacea]
MEPLSINGAVLITCSFTATIPTAIQSSRSLLHSRAPGVLHAPPPACAALAPAVLPYPFLIAGAVLVAFLHAATVCMISLGCISPTSPPCSTPCANEDMGGRGGNDAGCGSQKTSGVDLIDQGSAVVNLSMGLQAEWGRDAQQLQGGAERTDRAALDAIWKCGCKETTSRGCIDVHQMGGNGTMVRRYSGEVVRAQQQGRRQVQADSYTQWGRWSSAWHGASKGRHKGSTLGVGAGDASGEASGIWKWGGESARWQCGDGTGHGRGEESREVLYLCRKRPEGWKAGRTEVAGSDTKKPDATGTWLRRNDRKGRNRNWPETTGKDRKVHCRNRRWPAWGGTGPERWRMARGNSSSMGTGRDACTESRQQRGGIGRAWGHERGGIRTAVGEGSRCLIVCGGPVVSENGKEDDDTDVIRSVARRLVSLAIDGDLPMFLVSPVLNPPCLLRPILYIPETIAHLPPYSLDPIKAVSGMRVAHHYVIVDALHRAGNRTVYGHGRKFTDRDCVDFFVHGTVKNPTVTLRIDRNGRNRKSNPGLADQDHMQSTSSADIDLPYFTVKKRPGIDPQKRTMARHRDRITVPYSVATRLRWPALSRRRKAGTQTRRPPAHYYDDIYPARLPSLRRRIRRRRASRIDETTAGVESVIKLVVDERISNGGETGDELEELRLGARDGAEMVFLVDGEEYEDHDEEEERGGIPAGSGACRVDTHGNRRREPTGLDYPGHDHRERGLVQFYLAPSPRPQQQVRDPHRTVYGYNRKNYGSLWVLTGRNRNRIHSHKGLYGTVITAVYGRIN